MRKKLLAGVMALALCSTNMPPQTIFAGEFTSGNLEEVTEEIPEIFSDDNQEVIEETEEELSVFSSESIPEFSNEANVMPATAEITEIDLNNTNNPLYNNSRNAWIIRDPGSYRFNGNGNITHDPIIIKQPKHGNFYIYLNNVNIVSGAVPALVIDHLTVKNYIYLENSNSLESHGSESALQINPNSETIINNSPGNNGSLTAKGYFGIGNHDSKLTINGGSVTAFSESKTGIGGKNFNIIINGGSVTASSTYGTGIESGLLTINGGSVTASSQSETGIDIKNGSLTIKDGSIEASSQAAIGIDIENGSLTIKGGSVKASSTSRTGIKSNSLTIEGGSIDASSQSGTGIESNSLTIEGGSVKASSTSRTGIESGSLTIKGGSVTASSANEQEKDISSNHITINGGSVKASSVSSAPTNDQGKKVYCCTIENPDSEDVIIIDVDETSTLWNPQNHKAVDPNNKKLYAWLTGETHTISVGGKKQTYYFEETSNPFKPITNNDFILSSPNLTYNGTAQAPLECNIEDIKDEIKLSYYENDVPQPNGAINAGTYTVTANIAGNSFADKSWTFTIKPATFDEDSIEITAYNKKYDGNEHPVITGRFPDGSNVKYSTESPNETTTWSTICPNVKTVADAKKTNVWIKISKDNYATKIYGPIQATINPASEAPGYTTQTTIPVPWSCKKINDITNSLPTNWIWSSKVDPNQDLQVGKPITATAIYKGSDKGNYYNEEITYTIIRNECEHKNTVGRYYSSPSCTSNGYSGDTYCNDCERTIYYGSTIPAYGHDYDNGVITTEPTAETDGIITYTCKRCKHQDTKVLGKLGDGEPYIEGSFQKKGWDAVNDLVKASKEKDIISITLNGSRTLPASVLSGIKGKDISLNLDMENGFIWKINGTSITAETPADIDLSVTNTAEYIPAALYSLISTNQNDFGFHLGRNGAFDFPAVLSVKADASCAGLMANLFWYDVENGVLQCIQTVTVGGAFERSIPYADFTLSKGQDYFIAFGTESLNGRVIHTDGSITDENGAYLRPANAKISSHSIDRNKLTVKLSKGCAGAQGYDFVISKKSNMLQTGKFSKTVSSTDKPQASFRYLAKGNWYVAARSWVLDAQGNKVYGSWTKIKKIKITVVTPQQPKIRNITIEGNTVTVTYTKCKNATGYEILLGNKYKTSAGEKYPVKKYVKRTEGKNTVTVTFTNVKKGTWYVTVRSWNKTSKNKSRVYSPYSDIKKFKVKK